MDLEIRTHGPINRFANVLFIEKEGFFPLLESAQIAERFDLALMSSKGMSNTSARTLIEGLAGVRFLVLHDFDKYGFAIAGTLRTDTWRYQFSRPVEVVDIGLRLGDVKAEKLDGEPMQVPESSAINLRRHGATEEEIAYLTDKGSGRGQRVELNAMTSPQFVQFLERKLKKHGVKKLIPDETALAEAYRRIWVSERVKSDLDAIYQIALKEAETLMIPKNLIARIKAEFGKRLTLSWDAALKAIVQEDDLEAGT
jgi:hypothetical protein